MQDAEVDNVGTYTYVRVAIIMQWKLGKRDLTNREFSVIAMEWAWPASCCLSICTGRHRLTNHETSRNRDAVALARCAAIS